MHSTAPNSDAHKAIHTVLCGVHFSVIVALAPTVEGSTRQPLA